jgi:hypothetical protein
MRAEFRITTPHSFRLGLGIAGESTLLETIKGSGGR